MCTLTSRVHSSGRPAPAGSSRRWLSAWDWEPSACGSKGSGRGRSSHCARPPRGASQNSAAGRPRTLARQTEGRKESRHSSRPLWGRPRPKERTRQAYILMDLPETLSRFCSRSPCLLIIGSIAQRTVPTCSGQTEGPEKPRPEAEAPPGSGRHGGAPGSSTTTRQKARTAAAAGTRAAGGAEVSGQRGSRRTEGCPRHQGTTPPRNGTPRPGARCPAASPPTPPRPAAA